MSIALVLAGCSSFSGKPSKEETDLAFDRMAELAPGQPEAKIEALFDVLPVNATGDYGILESSTYVAGATTSRTYWIGYYYIGSGGYVTAKRIVSYTAVNGRIESAYFP